MSDSQGKLVFPVNPEKIEIECEANNQSYDLLNVGEVVVPGPKGLRTFSFSSYFPYHKRPQDYIDQIEALMRDKEVVRLLITRRDMSGEHLWDSNCKAVIDSFKYEEVGGEVGTVFFEIELTEYRDFTVRVIV